MTFRSNDDIIIPIGVLYSFLIWRKVMDEYMTTKEAANKWGISVRQVQNYCKNGRIEGVQRIGTNYLIPRDTSKPKYTYVFEKDDSGIK